MSNGLQKLMEMKRAQQQALATPKVEEKTDAAKADVQSAPRTGGFKLNIAGTSGISKGVDSVSESKPVGEHSNDAVHGTKTGTSNPLARLAALKTGAQVPQSPVESPDFSLEDLAAADVADEGSVIRERSDFFDEIDAQAPVRELPPELNQQQKQFIDSLDGIYTVLNDPEMFGQMIRNIMMELTQNPEYIKLVVDQDVHTMIRAMRNTMGLAKIKKIDSKAKKSNGAGRGRKTSPADEEMLSTLEGLAGFDGGDM